MHRRPETLVCLPVPFGGTSDTLMGSLTTEMGDQMSF